MVAKSLVLGIAILILGLVGIGTVLNTQNSAWAVTILCPLNQNFCSGTNSGDSIAGNVQSNVIRGCGGDDVISGSLGADIIIADSIGGDPMCPPGGQPGSDRITGGPGDDSIDSGPLPDGHRDVIDCGPGNDGVEINVSVDHDIATNCETVSAG